MDLYLDSAPRLNSIRTGSLATSSADIRSERRRCSDDHQAKIAHGNRDRPVRRRAVESRDLKQENWDRRCRSQFCVLQLC